MIAERRQQMAYTIAVADTKSNAILSPAQDGRGVVVLAPVNSGPTPIQFVTDFSEMARSDRHVGRAKIPFR